MSETSIVLPPALSAMEYVSARPLFRAFLSRLACLLAAFSSVVSISLHQSIRIRMPYTGLQMCAQQHSSRGTAVLTCTQKTRGRLQAFCLAGITLQRLSDVHGAMQLLRTIRVVPNGGLRPRHCNPPTTRGYSCYIQFAQADALSCDPNQAMRMQQCQRLDNSWQQQARTSSSHFSRCFSSCFRRLRSNRSSSVPHAESLATAPP